MEVIPDIHRGSAPDIVMGLLLAADMRIFVGISWSGFNPNLSSITTPARHDWQPVSAMAGTVAGPMQLENAGLYPRSHVSAGSADRETSRKGWGSDARRSQVSQNSL